MLAGVLEIEQVLALEAVAAHVGYRPLDARLVLGPPHAGRVDDKAARLRVLQESQCDLWRKRVGLLADRLRVVRD